MTTTENRIKATMSKIGFMEMTNSLRNKIAFYQILKEAFVFTTRNTQK